MSPLGLRMSMTLGKPSIVHRPLIHGPAPTTTCSVAIVPWLVRTAVTAPGQSDQLVSSPDNLHPSPDGYRLMALALEPAIKRALQKAHPLL